MSLLKTIKEHDAKMSALETQNEYLVEVLGRLVDNIIDNDLALCVDFRMVEEAVASLKQEKWMDSTRQRNFDNAVNGLCDTSVYNMKAVDPELRTKGLHENRT